ncbi:conserved exported hypothetical protein [Candidatus Terasakiella magnetica]|uniref:Solute-binding protein family 3/N-terminal domain-containing protein n=1 Tax=Candidatus Terasakiella magnetica TaxID=1867952 RepID=A0A1C3RIJ6_9PROT|nr:hypothetical protein [Candidatus Terasakiella magnetica]SCA57107.1 conserved exported hypothetical protein [Candidatus Terasakiella magnetica]
MIRLFIATLLLINGFGSLAYGDEKTPDDSFVIGTFSYPPLLHKGKDGAFSGTLGETVKLICEKAALNCRFKILPLKRVYQELRGGKVDALVTLDLGQFPKCCLISKWRSPWAAGLFSTLPANEIPKIEKEIYGKKLIVVNGMRSPYSFLPEMDKLAKEGKIKLYVSKHVSSSANMFAKGRAELLWGGEDFTWHLKKIAPHMAYNFRPLLKKNVVLWARKEHQGILDKFDEAVAQLRTEQTIGEDGKLHPDLMAQTYQEPAS